MLNRDMLMGSLHDLTLPERRIRTPRESRAGMIYIKFEADTFIFGFKAE